jgi:hypothetical protein
MKGKYLITSDNWFYTPDGRQYKAVWGEVEILLDEFLGIKTNIRSSNWFAKIGTEKNHVIIAGCQIHYACKCEKKPKANYLDINIIDGVTKTEERPYAIYIAT